MLCNAKTAGRQRMGISGGRLLTTLGDRRLDRDKMQIVDLGTRSIWEEPKPWKEMVQIHLRVERLRLHYQKKGLLWYNIIQVFISVFISIWHTDEHKVPVKDFKHQKANSYIKSKLFKVKITFQRIYYHSRLKLLSYTAIVTIRT